MSENKTEAPEQAEPPVDGNNAMEVKQMLSKIRNPQDKRWVVAMINALRNVPGNFQIPKEPTEDAMRALFNSVARHTAGELAKAKAAKEATLGDWRCHVFGRDAGFKWVPNAGKRPGFVRRFFMWVILGSTWERIQQGQDKL